MRNKVSVGLMYMPELVERARNAVWHLGHGLTVAGLAQDSFERAVAGLEAEHNHGRPFPQRRGPLGRVKGPPGRVGIGLRLPPELLERARNAVCAVEGVSMNSIAEDELRRTVEGLEAAHNHGQPFTQRT